MSEDQKLTCPKWLQAAAERLSDASGSLATSGDALGVDYAKEIILEAIAGCGETWAASPWRRIETAPKDGSEVILYVSGFIIIGRYLLGSWRSFFGDPLDPTHWMPLPPAPEANP